MVDIQFQQGAKVKITEVVGTIEINDNTYFAKVIDANNIDLFRDPDLNDGIDGTLSGAYGTYHRGGKIKYGGGFRDPPHQTICRCWNG